MTAQKPSRLPAKTRNFRPPAAPGERLVTLANALNRAAQRLNLSEKRMVFLALSGVDSVNRAPREMVSPFKLLPMNARVTAKSYAELFGVSESTAYTQIQTAADSLFKKSIQFHADDCPRGKTPSTYRVSWVTQAEYQKGEGWIELRWNEALLEHITNLKSEFTSYKLKQAAALRSLYSWRLLEQLEQWKSVGRYAVSVAEFMDTMEAAPSQRKTFGEFRRKVIAPALRELREKDDWLIELQEVKLGRRVDRLVFTFEKNPQQSLL